MLTWLSKHLFFPLWDIKDGAHRSRYLRELQATQWIDSETLRQNQWERTREIVDYAFRHCSYYEARLRGSGFDGTLRNWEEFRRLPLLAKHDIRDNPDGLLSREYRREVLVQTKTGGSTGHALTLYFDKRCQELRNAAAMRSDQWAGWDIGMKVAAVWGNPPVSSTVKQRLRNLLLDRFMYLDTMDVSDSSIARFVADWRREHPQVLFGHSHSLYVLALSLRRFGVGDLRPRGIISTSMMLLGSERQLIEQVFACPVTNRYGCEEVSLIASECERHDGMHLNVDHVVVEFLRPDGSEAPPGEEGEIVVTDLVNRGMPLIRYRVDDLGVPSRRACACGRGLPIMERLTGRTADFLKRADGSLVAGVSLVEHTLTAIAGIEQMQLVQDEVCRLRVKVVQNALFDFAAKQRLRSELETVFGEGMFVEIEEVVALDQTRSGKYRFAICNV